MVVTGPRQNPWRLLLCDLLRPCCLAALEQREPYTDELSATHTSSRLRRWQEFRGQIVRDSWRFRRRGTLGLDLKALIHCGCSAVGIFRYSQMSLSLTLTPFGVAKRDFCRLLVLDLSLLSSAASRARDACGCFAVCHRRSSTRSLAKGVDRKATLCHLQDPSPPSWPCKPPRDFQESQICKISAGDNHNSTRMRAVALSPE